MPRIVLSAYDVARSADVAGHLWVYVQYVEGLRANGCDVWWLERLPADTPAGSAERLAEALAPFGLADRLLLYTGATDDRRWVNGAAERADDVIAEADLLLNFHYRIDAQLLRAFHRSALVDIDPGLLQLWMSERQLHVEPHDLYFTTGATVGTPDARFAGGGLPWLHIQPPVSLDQWPTANGNGGGPFTTVSSWWADEWVRDRDGFYENNKRVSFLAFRDVAAESEQPLELALNSGPKDQPDLDLLTNSGWSVRHVHHVAGTPDAYRSYIRSSRGEFSCAKPSCMRLNNGWVSDRTLCYLASGRPAVVQHTGPNLALDGGEGLLRFSTPAEAVAALQAVAVDYARHRRAARALAEEHFDARKVTSRLLELALSDARVAR
jgi:hypothetical protein